MKYIIDLTIVLSLILLISFRTFSQLRPIHIDSLYKGSAFVGIVKVIEGSYVDKFGYMYKAEVLECLKGDSTRFIEFGIFAGTEIGSQYLMFLSNKEENFSDIKLPSDSTKIKINNVYYIRYAGLGEMPLKYFLEADGYALIIATSKIIVPDSIHRFPFLLEAFNIWDKYYFKKEDIINYLKTL